MKNVTRNNPRLVSKVLKFIAAAAMLECVVAQTEPLDFKTLAGYAGQGGNDGSGISARFVNPWGVAVDAGGNVYVADTENHIIRKITAGGLVTTVAGQNGVSGSADGTGTNALFNLPQGIAVDGATNLYVADTANHTIRKITPSGVVSTLAGLAGSSGTNNATGGSARFYEPEGIAVNSAGSLIYVGDTWNHGVRQITSLGAVTTLAGTLGTPGTNNGAALSAQFNNPQGIAVDSAGNVYVGDTGNQVVRKIAAGGAVTMLAGSFGNFGTNNGTTTAAQFWDPQGVSLDGATNVYVADSFNNTIRKITPAGVVTTLAGAPGVSGSADGAVVVARFSHPQGVAADAAGNVYVADSGNGTIRKIVAGPVVSTLAGSASVGSADGAGTSARFFGPSSTAIDASGNAYVADAGNNTIRFVTSAGVVSTFAGSAGVAGTNDGGGAAARFSGPQGVAANAAGSLLYVADTLNHTIRKITSSGTVSTFAGSAGSNGIADGSGALALFNSPQGVAVDSSGTVYVADTWNHTIRKITSGGAVTTLAGVPGNYGDLDSNMPGYGTNGARFNCPSGIAVDLSGNIYVADTRNHIVRRVTAAGIVTTLAGLAGVWGSADGTNDDARFYLPEGIAVDAAGNLFVLDSGNHTVRMMSLVGTNWVVTTVAGSPDVAGSADGSGGSARFFQPGGIGVNNSGAFSIADWGNNTIRSGISASSNGPSILVQPTDQTANQGQNASFSVTAAGSAPLAYQWFFNGTNIAGATSSGLVVNAQILNAGSYSVVVSNAIGSVASSNALLTIIVPPAISNAPQGLTVNQGANAGFSVTASGTAPFAYQWLFNGGAISTASASSYTLTNAQPGDAGSYSVIVSNAAGAVTSAPAVLAVNAVPTPPSIGVAPQSIVVSQNSNATFTVTAFGSSPLHYQWLFYGTNLAGATTTSYTRVSAQPANAGPYAVVVTNAYGAITSAPGTLTVILPPVINVQPVSQLAAVSNNVTFTVGLSQGTSPAYQWRQNGSPIAGATQSSLTLASISWSSAGTYSVVVTNSAGGATSSDVTLTVQQAEFTFYDGFEGYQTGSLDNNTSGGPNVSAANPWWGVNTSAQGWITNASSGVTPHGGSQMDGAAGSVRQEYINLLYRMNAGQLYYGNFMCDWWFYDPYGANAAGATNFQEYVALAQYAPVSTSSDSSSFSTFTQRMSLGSYNGNVGYNYSNYQARIVGGSGTFGSGNSWYNTTVTRSVGWHHARIIVGIPNPATLLAPVSMYIDNLTNATVASPSTGLAVGFNLLELNHQFKAGYAGYYDDFTFRAANDPWIIEQPVSQVINPGDTATLNTVAVGTDYQWQFNGTNIAGATNTAYTVASAAGTNVGLYTCLISGTNGVLATTPAALTFSSPLQPGHFDSLNLLPGNSLQLHMSGTPYLNYVLECTGNWTGWTPLATVSGTNGQFQFTDLSVATNATRFYRLRVGP